MTECQLVVSSIGVMQRLERSVDRRLWAGTAAQAAAVTMKNEVGGVATDRVGKLYLAYIDHNRPIQHQKLIIASLHCTQAWVSTGSLNAPNIADVQLLNCQLL